MGSSANCTNLLGLAQEDDPEPAPYYGLAVDGNGNVYYTNLISAPGQAYGEIVEVYSSNTATPPITWVTPAAIAYGTALSSTQLNATSTVAGSFSYFPPSGTILGPGQQTLSTTFIPADSADYTTATATVLLTVGKATPAINWATPAAISYGTALSAAQLNATSTVAGSFVYSPAAGTVLSPGPQTLTANFIPTDTTDYATATATVTLSVNKAAPTIGLVASSNPAYVSNVVTFTATVSLADGSPTGTVSFYNGTTLLGPGTMSAGVATYATSTLTAGTHSISAVYSGDGNFTTVTSNALSETIENFTIGIPSGGTTSVTVSPGGQAVYTFAVTPPSGDVFAGPITFTVSGLPAGVTAAFSPATIPAGAGAASVTMTVTLANTAAAHPLPSPFDGGTLPVALGLILLPFAGRLRRGSRGLKGMVCLMVLGLVGTALTVGLSGCGGSAGGQASTPPQNYTLTITAASGSLSNTSTVTLIVE